MPRSGNAGRRRVELRRAEAGTHGEVPPRRPSCRGLQVGSLCLFRDLSEAPTFGDFALRSCTAFAHVAPVGPRSLQIPPLSVFVARSSAPVSHPNKRGPRV